MLIIPDKKIKMGTLPLNDKFAIICNDIVNIPDDEIGDLLDNYFENLLHSNERTIHSDLLSQIFWFKKEFDFSTIMLKHLENFLKQKKSTIRNNIKKGNFEIDTGLNKLIESYFEKINSFLTHVQDKEEITKVALAKLYDQIISDPSLISYLKSEVSNLDNDNRQNIIKLTFVLKKISEINPDLKSYQWFLFLISSALSTVTEESNNESFPVPESFQKIINFRKVLSFYEQAENYYKFINNDINIVLTGIISIILNNLLQIMNFCTMKELISLVKNYSLILEKIFSNSVMTINGKNIKDLFTLQFFMFLERMEKNNKELDLGLLIECFQVINNLLNANGNTMDIINNKLALVFSNEESQNYLLEKINQFILTSDEKIEASIYNILCVCSNIKDKDKFIEKYNRLLVNRILFKPNLIVERNFYNVLQTKVNDKLIIKTNKIITDMESTLADRENFKTLLETNGFNKIENNKCLNKLSVVTTSYNNWDINQQEGILTYDTILKNKDECQLVDALYTYDKFYQKRFNNKRKLNWYPHFGEVKFNYLNKEIQMLPIQFMVLEAIEQVIIVDKESIMNMGLFKGYTTKFKNSVITSLIVGGIVKIEKEKLVISKEIEKISSDFISLFFSSTNYTDVWNKKREEELIMTRKDTLSACINHFIKKENTSVDILYTLIKSSMNLFDFQKSELVEVIEMMVTKDYLKIDDGIVTKIFY
jgi:hypothetical protein